MRLVVAARNNRLMLFYEYLGFLDTEFYFILVLKIDCFYFSNIIGGDGGAYSAGLKLCKYLSEC